MNSYNEFAEVYDFFMEDVDYEAWCQHIANIFELYGKTPKKILDTACGTGNITIPLASAGHEMWGLDISEDMLSIAESKARALKKKIKFLHQDMTKMNSRGNFGAVLCMCDGVNYINSEEGLVNYFNLVYKSLEKEGIFLFDISSFNKIRITLGNNTFYEEKNNKYYIWNNNFDEVSETVEMNLVFFIPQGNLFRKFEEQHIQKAYKCEYLAELLKKAGFEELKILGDFSFSKPDENSERIFFAAIKK